MPSNNQFTNNSGIPASILNDVMDLKMRESEKNASSAAHNSALWEDNEFPDGPEEGFLGDQEDGDPMYAGGVLGDDDESPKEQRRGGEPSGDMHNVMEILDELLDQQRQMSNNVSSMELAISNIQEFLKSGSRDNNSKEIVESLKEVLESFSGTSVDSLEKKFSYFNKENIRQLFDQIDQKMRILNERDKSWQTSLEKASDALGKKVIVWTLVFSFGFSLVTSICFILFYSAIRHILPLL